MYLFGLDLWESRFLVAINWVLNALVKIFLLAVVLTALQHHKPDSDQDDEPASGWSTSEEGSALEAIAEMGGTSWHEGTGADAPVVRVSFAGKPISDAELADLVQLKGLASLQTLDLSGTRITDAGLAHLKGLHKLQTVVLTGSRVTAAGVAALQKALPRARIIR